MNPLAITVSSNHISATSGWLVFLLGVIVGMVIGIYLHKR